MSASPSGFGRLFSRLLEAFAGICGPDWIVHQSLFGCAVVAASSVLPLDADPDDPDDRSSAGQPELSWHQQGDRWRLDGDVLPAGLTDEPGRRRSPEERDRRR